jgi:hypothetical protein
MPVNEASPTRRRERLVLALSFVLLSCVALGIAGRDLEVPGLYYDEVIQAEPAVQFLADDGRPSRIPGARTTRLFGGWFPVMIQPYMGALKSHVLMPAFAGFGATAASLRLTTLVCSLVGLLFAMLWAREALGTRVAIVAGALLAVDPSFLLTSRHDWGSFALGFLCRCGGLYFVTTGWTRHSAWRLFAGGLCFGLGIYNKIDFGVFLVAAGLALAIALPRIVSEMVRSRGLRPLPAALGFLLGAGPMIAVAGAALAATQHAVRRQAGGFGDWTEKLHAFAAVLDGSYFHKLMLSGGSFERMFEAQGAETGRIFLVAFLAFGVGLGSRLWRDRRRGELDPAQAFVWLATLATALGVLLTPRAVRIHHILNLTPFPQLVVSIALVRLWEGAPAGGPARLRRRAVASIALCAVLAGSLHVGFRTLETIRESGGKGRWSDALGEFASELASQPGALAVSLDWGFDGPLRYAARDLAHVEPIWKIRRNRLEGRAWRFAGTARHVYLVFEADLAVFDFGPEFLEAAREMPAEDVRIRRHLDRQGDLAFLSVRFSRPHELVYAEEFEVRMRRVGRESTL